MITTRKELKQYIDADMARYSKRKYNLLYYLCGDETGGVIRLLKRWRKTEYYYNTYNKHNPFSLLRFCWSFFIYRRMQLKYDILLPLNVVGPGLYIPHRVGG